MQKTPCPVNDGYSRAVYCTGALLPVPGTTGDAGGPCIGVRRQYGVTAATIFEQGAGSTEQTPPTLPVTSWPRTRYKAAPDTKMMIGAASGSAPSLISPFDYESFAP